MRELLYELSRFEPELSVDPAYKPYKSKPLTKKQRKARAKAKRSRKIK